MTGANVNGAGGIHDHKVHEDVVLGHGIGYTGKEENGLNGNGIKDNEIKQIGWLEIEL